MKIFKILLSAAVLLTVACLEMPAAGQADVPLGGNVAPAASANCAPLTLTVGTVVTVSNVTQLMNAVNASNARGGNTTILLQDGTYVLNDQLWLEGTNIIIRSVSGNRNNVVIRGQGMSGGVSHVFNVNASNVTIADITFGEIANHAVQVHGENDKDNLWVHNVRIYNTGEQMVKGSYSSSGPASDHGIVECSLFEYTAGIGPQYYIGGIDVHGGANWIVRDNEFRHIRSPEEDLSEHAIHFWSNASGTLVERNKIVNCDRGIGFGLDSRGHVGGIIRNNMVYVTRDVGIGLESAPGARVYNNSVYVQNYSNAIEYRFATTSGVEIINNLTNAAIASRDGGSGTVQNNVTNAQSSWFVSATTGNLHLASGSLASVIDRGQTLSSVNDDFDGDARPQGSAFDIGADEYVVAVPRVTDLRVRCVVESGTLTATLSWTPLTSAVTTTVYYSDTLITGANWPAASVLGNVPGGTGSYTAVVPYVEGKTAYLALRSALTGGSWSALSNVAFCPHEDIFLPLVMRGN
ncbi:MAG TPA: right-handed parallel beta-helix repeat-containing protein [Anaerolineae bacterium]|nr:right-handed parallel beta-helix repeat-containing protein [Anaerolineae bacterium]HQK13269.1 right-handed parallel beta-helix repeat-containing protein [Anaerolineae bacterium]